MPDESPVDGGNESDHRVPSSGNKPPDHANDGHNLVVGVGSARRPPSRSRRGVSEAVTARQGERGPRSLVPVHHSTKGWQVDSTAKRSDVGRSATWDNPQPHRDELEPRCKRTPHLDGRRISHPPVRGRRIRQVPGLIGLRSTCEMLSAGTWDWPVAPRWDLRLSCRGERQAGRYRPAPGNYPTFGHIRPSSTVSGRL